MNHCPISFDFSPWDQNETMAMAMGAFGTCNSLFILNPQLQPVSWLALNSIQSLITPICHPYTFSINDVIGVETMDFGEKSLLFVFTYNALVLVFVNMKMIHYVTFVCCVLIHKTIFSSYQAINVSQCLHAGIQSRVHRVPHTWRRGDEEWLLN